MHIIIEHAETIEVAKDMWAQNGNSEYSYIYILSEEADCNYVVYHNEEWKTYVGFDELAVDFLWDECHL